jgi:hypothetical protein
MRRPGWNPVRRNRHVGTKAHGHGDDNRLTIPQSWHRPLCYYELLNSTVALKRDVAGRSIQFLIEPARPGCFYPCTVDDVCALLAGVPSSDLNAIDLIVFRQPTRKQTLLAPVWGRAIFEFETDGFSGRAIVLEAQSGRPYRWTRRLSPEVVRELERLNTDGHGIERSPRGVTVRPTPASLRHTVLYRTLLHELGHHIDYRRSTDDEWDGKTRSTKEDFAHRYATETFQVLKSTGVAPFAPLLDPVTMARDQLRPEWFQPDDRDTLAESPAESDA